MWARFKRWFYLFAVALTQGVINTTVAGLWWVVTGNGDEPDPDEPFSSRVGRNAIAKKRWALAAEVIVDGIFGKGHCRESALDRED